MTRTSCLLLAAYLLALLAISQTETGKKIILMLLWN